MRRLGTNKYTATTAFVRLTDSRFVGLVLNHARSKPEVIRLRRKLVLRFCFAKGRIGKIGKIGACVA